jgi:hypothetical protein
MPSAAAETATTAAATERLARLMAAVEQAKRRLAAREAELAERRRELASLWAEREDYERAVGAGARRKPDTERRLAEALSAPGIAEREDALTDTLAEARLAGAREAHGAAQEELRAYCRDHLAAIEAELRRGEAAERQAALEAARELARALTPMRKRWRRLHGVYVLAGRPEEAPRAPFESAARALAAMERE